jgi:glutamate synthase (NADPH/NADH) large chain
MVFVYDPDQRFAMRVNPDTVTWQRVAHPHWDGVLKSLIERHVAETNSRYARMLVHDWDRTLPNFWQVVPKEYVKYLPVPLSEAVAEPLRA